MAYLKMDKNLSAKLITVEDYLSWSEKCLKEANSYFEISNRCKDMAFSEYNNAFLTNVSFSCELYLKYLLLKSKIDCRREHNLYRLYKKLPDEIQQKLKVSHPCGINVN